MIGLGVENNSQFNMIKTDSNNNKHIIYTNITRIPDMLPIKETLKICHISGGCTPNATNNWTATTSFLSYSYHNCRADSTNQGQYYYFLKRNFKYI